MSVHSFTFWLTYYDVAQELTVRQQEVFYRAICEYMFADNDIEDELKGSTRIAFKAIKANMKTSKRRAEAGESKPNQKRIKTESKAKQDKDKDKDKDKGEESLLIQGIPDDAKAALIDLGLMKGERNAQ